MKKKFPWKSWYRSIPANFIRNIDGMESNLVVVAATKKIRVSDIAEGKYAHIGLSCDDKGIVISSPVLPSRKVGKYAERNLDGWEAVRKDLPMIVKSFSVESPNFGNAVTYGTHTHYWDKEVYQREVFEPRMFLIKVDLLNGPSADTALVKFEVDQILDKDTEQFEQNLLFCLNLLQESTGVAGVYPANSTREDFIGTMIIDWEIFPPGNAEDVIRSIVESKGREFKEKYGVVTSRVELFNELPVKSFIRGSGGFGAYIGALYADNLVVFENVNYGNALYVLYDGWESISKRSRLELLKGTTEKFDRIVHTKGWENRFKLLIENKLKELGVLTHKKSGSLFT